MTTGHSVDHSADPHLHHHASQPTSRSTNPHSSSMPDYSFSAYQYHYPPHPVAEVRQKGEREGQSPLGSEHVGDVVHHSVGAWDFEGRQQGFDDWSSYENGSDGGDGRIGRQNAMKKSDVLGIKGGIRFRDSFWIRGHQLREEGEEQRRERILLLSQPSP